MGTYPAPNDGKIPDLCDLMFHGNITLSSSRKETIIMANAVFFNTYALIDGSSVPDFLLAVENLIKEHISNQKGYISFKLLAEGDAWADYVIFDTPDNLNAFLEASETNTNEYAEKFYSFLNFDTCISHIYSVEMSL